MLLDHMGREIVRRKQYGLTRGPLEYVLAVTPAALEGSVCDAIGYTILHPHDDEEEDDEGTPEIT